MDQTTDKSLDGYQEWLGIPLGPRPPNHYVLLGLELFESDVEVIRRNANDRVKIVRPRCLKHRDLGTTILNEIAKAVVCLTDLESKAVYDATLRKGDSHAEQPAAPEAIDRGQTARFATIDEKNILELLEPGDGHLRYATSSEPSDGYCKWLGIPSGPRPPNHYVLLGIDLYESDEQIIRTAADDRMRLVQSQSVEHLELGKKILIEITTAKKCLTNLDDKAAYDWMLRNSRTISRDDEASVSKVAADEASYAAYAVCCAAIARTLQRWRRGFAAQSPVVQITIVCAALVGGLCVIAGGLWDCSRRHTSDSPIVASVGLDTLSTDHKPGRTATQPGDVLKQKSAESGWLSIETDNELRTLSGQEVRLSVKCRCPSIGGRPSARIDWGDGAPTNDQPIPVATIQRPDSLLESAGLLLVKHKYAKSGQYLVRITVTADRAAPAERTLMATVSNVQMKLDVNGDQHVAEGEEVRVTAMCRHSGQTDRPLITIDWGDNSHEDCPRIKEPDFKTVDVHTITSQHLYQRPGRYQVIVTATGSDGGSVTASLRVHVAQGVPMIIENVDLTKGSGTKEYRVSARVRHRGGVDKLTAKITWGDGTQAKCEVTGSDGTIACEEGMISAAHKYASNGSYRVIVDVSDGKASVTQTRYVLVAGELRGDRIASPPRHVAGPQPTHSLGGRTNRSSVHTPSTHNKKKLQFFAVAWLKDGKVVNFKIVHGTREEAVIAMNHLAIGEKHGGKLYISPRGRSSKAEAEEDLEDKR